MDKKIKSKEKYAGWSYIVSRMEYLNSINQFRCFAVEEGKERCGEICGKCSEYYEVEK